MCQQQDLADQSKGRINELESKAKEDKDKVATVNA